MKRSALALTLAAALCAGGCCRHTVADNAVSAASHTEALQSHSALSDTLICRDTLSVVLRGDTVRERAVAWRYRSIIVHDTVERTITDTIAVERTIAVAQASPWSGMRRALTGVACALCALAIIYVAIKLRRHL